MLYLVFFSNYLDKIIRGGPLCRASLFSTFSLEIHENACINTNVYKISGLKSQTRFPLLPERTSWSIASLQVAIPEYWEHSWKLLLRFNELPNDGMVFEDISVVMLLDFSFVGSLGQELLIEPLASIWCLLPFLLLLLLLLVSENSNSKFSGSVFRMWKIFWASSCMARACTYEGLLSNRWRWSIFSC